MFFVLHNYYDISIIFFVSVDLERKVFIIPQLSPISNNPEAMGSTRTSYLQDINITTLIRDSHYDLLWPAVSKPSNIVKVHLSLWMEANAEKINQNQNQNQNHFHDWAKISGVQL